MTRFRKITLTLFIAFFAMLFLVPQSVQAESPVTVDVVSYFDVDNTVTTHVESQAFGSKVSFASNLSSEVGYSFVYWIYNGILRQDLPLEYQFVVTTTTTLVGVFRPNDKYAAVFLDTNGRVLDIQFVSSGGNAVDLDTGSLPTKPGYVIATTRWDQSLTNITGNTVFNLQYTLSDATTYTVAVTNGSGDGTYAYNAYATAVADAPASGMYFSHWECGGRVVSKQSSYTFTVLENTTLSAAFADAVTMNYPMVTVGPALSLRTGYHTYLGHFEIPSGYELIEFGMIVSDTADQILTLESSGITRIQGSKYNSVTNEFVRSITTASSASRRAYLIVKDVAGNLITVYDEIITDAGTVASDLFFSYYIEGSSYNKAVAIYNGTGSAVDLSLYTLSLYSNGSPTASTSISLSGSLPNGAVYVIAHSSANATILGMTDLTNTSVINFNGDDAIALLKSGAYVDVIGKIGVDPGTEWGTGLTSTADNSLARKSTITSGRTDGTSDFDPATEWNGYAADTSTSLDTHTMDGAGVSPSIVTMEAHFGIYSYYQSSSLNVSGAYLRVFYSDGSAKTVAITSGMVSGFSTSTIGSFSLTVTYYASTTTYPYSISANPGSSAVEVHYIDIGATGGGPGEATLIQCGSTDILIDAGENSSVTKQALLAFLAGQITDGIIEYVIATHQDADHIGGMEVVFANYIVENAILYSTPASIATQLRNTFEAIVAAEADITIYHIVDIIAWETPSISIASGVSLAFYDTTYLENSSNSNYSSIVFTLEAYGTRILFNGDAEQNQEAVYGPLVGDVDIFKMGHHGTANATTAGLMSAIDPEVAIIMNGDFLGNEYSHPTYIAMSRIYTYSNNLPIYAVTGGNSTSASRMNQRNGTITVSIDSSGYSLTSENYGVNPIEMSNTDYWNDASNTYNTLGYYYATATGITSGTLLKSALNDIIDAHTSYSYAAIVEILKVTDADPNVSGNVLLFYTGRTQSADTFVGSTGFQDYWNREHIWAQSHGIDEALPGYTDLHHIRVTDVSVNATRGDLDFSAVSPHDGSTIVTDTYGSFTTYNYVNGSYFEPRDEIKGDIARMLFYMAVRYAGENGEPDLELVNGTTSSTSVNIGDLATLLLWNALDPVNDAERNRNDIVYSYQGNRNPFIDHPELVDVIFG